MIKTFTDESYLRILAEITAQENIWTEEGRGEVYPEQFDISQALKDATLPELEQLIRDMNKAYATLDFEALGEGYVYLFQNALESLKEMYERLYAEQQVSESEQETGQETSQETGQEAVV